LAAGLPRNDADLPVSEEAEAVACLAFAYIFQSENHAATSSEAFASFPRPTD